MRADPAARPGHATAAGARADPRRRDRRRPVPAADREQRQADRPRPRQQHHPSARGRALPADPQRPRRRPRRPRPRPRGGHPSRRPRAPADRQGPRDPRQAEPAARPARQGQRHDPAPRCPSSASISPASSATPPPPAPQRPSAATTSSPASTSSRTRSGSSSSTMVELQRFAEQATPVAVNLRKAAPGLTDATKALRPFSRAATISLTNLGNTTEASADDLAASSPVIRQLRKVGEKSIPGASNLNQLLMTLRKTGGIDCLTNFILNCLEHLQRLRRLRPLPAGAAADHELRRLLRHRRHRLSVELVAARTQCCRRRLDLRRSRRCGRRHGGA